jgi:[acyl-carrier-protein] S-malonyltransferase
VHNTDVAQHVEPAAIRQALIGQLYQPVRWVETIQYLQSQGVDTVVECGPGRVLNGLNKRISRELNLQSLHDPDALSAAMSQVSGAERGD